MKICRLSQNLIDKKFYREILSYLDNVDSDCIKTMQETFSYKIPESFRSDIEFAVEPDIVGDMPK